MAFTLFWLLNVAIGFGGSKILNRFTAILSPLIYVVIIGLTIWAIRAGGGLTPILSYQVSGAIRSVNPLVAYLIIFNSVVAVWSAPGASVADFTKNARSTRAQGCRANSRFSCWLWDFRFFQCGYSVRWFAVFWDSRMEYFKHY